MTQLVVAPAQQTVREKHGWRWVAFSAALAAMVIDRLDATIVNVAAPSIQASLGGSFADLQWTAAAYTLAMAVTLLVGGRLGDMFGRKRILLLGVAGFTAASVLCALSVNQAMLIGFRAVQGVFAAVMLPQVFGLVRDIFPPSHQRKAWVVLGPVIGLATVAGPIVGGALISLNLFGMGWRTIFLINLPIGVVVLLIGAWLIPRTAPPIESKRLDLLGILLAGTGMFLLVRPLVQGSTPTDRLMLLGAIPILFLFAWYQIKRSQSGRPSLIEPGPFRRRSFLSGIVFALSFLMALGGFVLTFSVFVQLGLSYSPLRASIATLPWAGGAFLGSTISAALVFRMGRNVIHLGLGLMGGGLLWLTAVIAPGATAWDFALPLLVGGTGMGMVFVPMFDIILGGLGNHEMGSGSAVLKAVQQLGLALGVAVIGSVFFGLLGAPADYVAAARWTSLVAACMIAIAFMLGYWLPKPSETKGEIHE
ncbi:MFS transporter [Allorhizocola rhizosphaerae]|uniref:MFS transporter n=1 Tax=Allorhizocola rhizosphaerae TaxID=1872709 RepID=UPI000E3D2391|nr:MFS transporter [Allorhizocola rhizosphaerae]